VPAQTIHGRRRRQQQQVGRTPARFQGASGDFVAQRQGRALNSHRPAEPPLECVRAKIATALVEGEFDALLAFGPDNFVYLTQSMLPFAEHYPERHAAVLLPVNGTPVVFAPLDWAEAIDAQGWWGDIHVFDENAPAAMVDAIVERAEAQGLIRSAIAVDTHRISRHLMQSLEDRLSKVTWAGADRLLEGLRIVKTDAEIARMEAACQQADRAFVHALMHLEGTVGTIGYTVAEFTERIRVHVNENGGSGVGLLATLVGPDARLHYAPQRGLFAPGQVFRMEASSHHAGYWCNLGRMGFTGKPGPEARAAYEVNRHLKLSALEMLRPGVACREVHEHVRAKARRLGAPLWEEVGSGHGVGASHHEPPYLARDCTRLLDVNMVIALDIYTRGPDEALMHDKDLYAITANGPRRLSWYRDWDRLYAVSGFRATH
jgi:Xaa-Pro aminopeptidase